jgi:hypothetical protein
MKSHPVAPGQTRSHPVKPGRTRSNPVAPGQTRSHPVAPGQTPSNLVKPRRTRSNLVKPGQTRSNLVKPGQTLSHLVKLGRNGSSGTDGSSGARQTWSHPVKPGQTRSIPAMFGRRGAQPSRSGRLGEGGSHQKEAPGFARYCTLLFRAIRCSPDDSAHLNSCTNQFSPSPPHTCGGEGRGEEAPFGNPSPYPSPRWRGARGTRVAALPEIEVFT